MAAIIPEFFPHEKIRAGQDQLILDLEKALEDGRIIIAHAPTGIGKTAGVVSVALKKAQEKGKKIFFLTNRHTQHKIVLDTIKQIQAKTGKLFFCADLLGKRWMCNQEVAGLFGSEFNEYCRVVVEKGECEFYNQLKAKKGLTVEGKRALQQLLQKGALHSEEVIGFGRSERMCSYELALGLAKDADIIIGDYYYVFNPHVKNTLFSKLDLELEDVILVVDEGHNLPNRVAEMASSCLTSHMLKNAVIEAKKHRYGGLIFWVQELARILSELTGPNSEKEKLVGKEKFLEEVQKVVDYEQLIEEMNTAADEIRKSQRRSYLGGISSFLESWKGSNEGFTRILSEHESKYGPVIMLQYTCLDPRIVTKEIFDRVHGGIVMSGTLKPTFMYKDLLGIEKSIENEYASPFPKKNKLTIIVPETTTKYNLRGETMYQKIADKCSEISSLIPGNVAFFFPSYQLRDLICRFIDSPKKKFWEKSEMSKEEKESFLEGFKAAKNEGGLLLAVTGANFAEGVDLPGDLLNGVVIIGVPLAHPDLKTQETIRYLEEKFGHGWDYGYIYPAINKCLQSAGRCIRSETDRGAVIYLDERFAWQNYFCCFPREGLMVSREYKKLLEQFFSETFK